MCRIGGARMESACSCIDRAGSLEGGQVVSVVSGSGCRSSGWAVGDGTSPHPRRFPQSPARNGRIGAWNRLWSTTCQGATVETFDDIRTWCSGPIIDG